MPENCPLYRYCNKECFLQKELKSQSRKGGSTSRVVDVNAGKYWTRENWEGYMTNLRMRAADGCRDMEGLNKLILEITKKKIVKRELVVKFQPLKI